MLVYVATFPRCGSGVLRRAIHLNFGHVTANGYPDNLVFPPKFEIEPVGEAVLSYLSMGQRRLMLRAPALPLLTPTLREELAARPELMFVKTHERPYDSFFPGEKVVQMVRHPGAALLSQYELERKIAPDENHTITQFIRGLRYGGSWADYHERWLEAEVPVVRMRYEDAYADQGPMIRALADFLELPLPRVVTETPDEARARNPGRNPNLGVARWSQLFGEKNFVDLEKWHGATAVKFGYGARTPDTDGTITAPSTLNLAAS